MDSGAKARGSRRCSACRIESFDMRDSEITAVLESKRELLKTILGIDKAINGLIEEEKTDELSEKLEERQGLLEQLDKVCRQIQKADAGSKPQVLIEEIDEIYAQIKEAELKNIELGSRALGRYRSQIKSLNQTKKSMGSYTRQNLKSDGLFIDAKK